MNTPKKIRHDNHCSHFRNNYSHIINCLIEQSFHGVLDILYSCLQKDLGYSQIPKVLQIYNV